MKISGDMVRGTNLELSQRFSGLLSQADTNRLLRTALGRALLSWIDVYLPKRWDRSYVRNLGYAWKYKEESKHWGGSTPFFRTGRMLNNAMRARVVVSATKSLARGHVTFPVGHPIDPQVLAAFNHVPEVERFFVAEQMRENALDIINNTPLNPTAGMRGKAQLALKMTKAQAADANVFSARNFAWGKHAVASRKLFGVYRNAMRIDAARQRGHAIGIANGDAAGSVIKIAQGRDVTQRNANRRYRNTAYGRATRRFQRQRARWRQSYARNALARTTA